MLKLVKSMASAIKIFLTAFFLLLLVTFMVSNHGNIEITFFPLPFKIEAKVFLVMSFFFGLGFFLGILSCSPRLIKGFIAGLKVKKLEKK